MYFCRAKNIRKHNIPKEANMGEKGKYCYDYWRPAVTADNVVFCFDGNHLNVLLIKRGREPYKDCWAFPGGFLEENETLEEAARRELKEETGLEPLYMEEIGAFSGVDRDPRGRVISGGFYSVVSPADKERAIAGDDAAQACWFPVNELPPLAFDHAEVFRKALVHLRIGFHLIPVAFLLLGDIFTIPDIQRLYTDVFCRTFDRRNFQKRFLKLGLVDPVDEPERSKRLPKRYRFNEEAYYQLRKKVMKF